MTNSFDPNGRGPSDRRLIIYGIAVLVVSGLLTTLLLAKSSGKLGNHVRVVADLINVGDGLPQKSDVKYHGVLVGSVHSVKPGAHGNPNRVNIDLTAEYAGSIPASVTARVVPSNVFAVSSVQLIGHGSGRIIRAGDHIPEDTTLPTVLFQTTVSKLRDLLAASARGRDDSSVGVIAALAAATDHRRTKLLAGGAQLDRLIDQLNSIVRPDAGPSTLSALIDATRGLQATAPDLVDALHEAVEPMQTFAETRSQLSSLIGSAQSTLNTSYQALNNHIDQMIKISSDLTPVVGVLAINAPNLLTATIKATHLIDRFNQTVASPEGIDNGHAMLSFSPTYGYTRADCPQYGELKGPSCYNAPLVTVRPDLPETLLPQNYHPPKSLAAPPGTVIGPDGNLIAVGPPLVNPIPNLSDPNPPLPPFLVPSPRVPGTADPDDAPPAAPAPNTVAPASFGGTVGPVGSRYEQNILSIITGKPASAATQLLLGPVARGTTVSFKSAPAAGVGR